MTETIIVKVHEKAWRKAVSKTPEMDVNTLIGVAVDFVLGKKQINEIAALYDWDMEVNTTDPEFYKWTQWIFVKMFKEGLAYEKEFPINWCPSCKTGLETKRL